jgi:mannose-6-phosphate isomerase-like protein (cupin superfamily)
MDTRRKPIIIRKSEIQITPLPPSIAGAKKDEDPGLLNVIIGAPKVDTKELMMGNCEINPGFAAHRWHNHVFDEGEGHKINYPKNFEEVYHIISGSGVCQWETEKGKIEEVKVSEGDTMFFPVGVTKHQLFNNSKEKINFVWMATPLVQVTSK